MASKQEVDEILMGLVAAFNTVLQDPAATLAQYEAALCHYPADLLRQAASKCLESCFKFPLIADFKREISAITAVRDTRPPEAKYEPMSPQMQKFWQDFHDRMVKSGKWTDRPRRRAQYNPYDGFTTRKG